MSLRIKNILTNRVSKLTLFIFFVLIVSAFFRFYRLEDFATFLGDQGRDAIVMKRIVTLEHFPAIGAPSSLGQIYLGPFYYYLVSPFLLLFNFNPVGPVFAVALLSFLGILAAFVAIKKEVSDLTALIFLFLTLFSFVNIQSSRFSWNPNLLPIFSFFTLYFFYKAFTTESRLFVYLAGAFLAFSFQLHHLAFSLVIPMVLWYLLLFSRTLKNKIKQDIKQFILFTASFLLFSLPLILFELKHNFLNFRNLLTLISEGNTANGGGFIASFLLSNQALYTYVFQTATTTLLPFLLTVSLTIFYLVKNVQKKKFSLVNLHLLNIVFFLVFFSLINTARNAHYYNVIYLSFFVILASFSTSLDKSKTAKTLVLILCIGIYLILNIRNLNYLFKPTKSQMSIANKVAQSIAEHTPKKNFQTIALPNVETDGHIRYFLEIDGYRPLPADTTTPPSELFVLCFEKKCEVLGNPQWQIASFKDAKIDTIWTVEGVKIYKLIHNQQETSNPNGSQYSN